MYFNATDIMGNYSLFNLIFVYFRVFHLALTVLLQYWLMRDLEKMAGTARITIIYLCAGCVGNLASAIFVPYRAEVGPAGAHFGLLATCMVEVSFNPLEIKTKIIQQISVIFI